MGGLQRVYANTIPFYPRDLSSSVSFGIWGWAWHQPPAEIERQLCILDLCWAKEVRSLRPKSSIILVTGSIHRDIQDV